MQTNYTVQGTPDQWVRPTPVEVRKAARQEWALWSLTSDAWNERRIAFELLSVPVLLVWASVALGAPASVLSWAAWICVALAPVHLGLVLLSSLFILWARRPGSPSRRAWILYGASWRPSQYPGLHWPTVLRRTVKTATVCLVLAAIMVLGAGLRTHIGYAAYAGVFLALLGLVLGSRRLVNISPPEWTWAEIYPIPAPPTDRLRAWQSLSDPALQAYLATVQAAGWLPLDQDRLGYASYHAALEALEAGHLDRFERLVPGVAEHSHWLLWDALIKQGQWALLKKYLTTSNDPEAIADTCLRAIGRPNSGQAWQILAPFLSAPVLADRAFVWPAISDDTCFSRAADKGDWEAFDHLVALLRPHAPDAIAMAAYHHQATRVEAMLQQSETPQQWRFAIYGAVRAGHMDLVARWAPRMPAKDQAWVRGQNDLLSQQIQAYLP